MALTLTMTFFHSGMTITQHAPLQGAATRAPKWKAVIKASLINISILVIRLKSQIGHVLLFQALLFNKLLLGS